MKYTMESFKDDRIFVIIEDAKKELPILEDEFRKCTIEYCNCNTDELKKLDFMHIEEKT